MKKSPQPAEKFTVDAAAMRDCSVSEWRSKIRNIFSDYGIVLLKNLIPAADLEKVQSEISLVIGLAMDKLKASGKLSSVNSLANAHRFDKGMMDICKADRAVGGEIFRVAKKFLSLQRITTSWAFESIAKALIGSEHVALHTAGTNIRADHPEEDHFLYPWHQDYIFNLGSEDSVTFWAPLVDVDDENGCLLIALQSHRQGIFPVFAKDPLNVNKNSAQSFAIKDLEIILKQFPVFSVPMQAGDVVAFHGNFLHSSQANRSQGTRWSMQFRYFNLAAADAVQRGWPGGMAEGVDFTKFHPEAVVQ